MNVGQQNDLPQGQETMMKENTENIVKELLAFFFFFFKDLNGLICFVLFFWVNLEERDYSLCKHFQIIKT